MSGADGVVTVNDICTQALKKAGILAEGQIASSETILDAQSDLSDMLGQWNVKTWLVWNKLDIGKLSDGRFTPYTVGPGTTDYVVTPRPDRIEQAYLRILVTSGQPVDQPLEQLYARESYAKIALKQLVAFPKAYFYDSASPTGNLFIYPWPTAALYETHIILKNSYPLLLPLATDLSTFPAAARAAMKFNLAVRLRQAYGKGLRPDQELNRLARDALATMRASQIQIPELTMPPTVMGRGPLYNIYGDVFY